MLTGHGASASPPKLKTWPITHRPNANEKASIYEAGHTPLPAMGKLQAARELVRVIAQYQAGKA